MYLNKALIYGNLTRDPELRALPSGNKVAEFGVATNRIYKDKDGNRKEAADFHNIVVYGRQAETVAQYLKKGSGVFIEGRIQTRNWDGQDGQKRYKTEIVADRVQFGPRPAGGGGGNWPARGQSAAPEAKGDEGAGEAIQYPEEESKPEDIPF